MKHLYDRKVVPQWLHDMSKQYDLAYNVCNALKINISDSYMHVRQAYKKNVKLHNSCLSYSGIS